ncbi:unnamed protein product [Adineta steineri]|uniref:Uncharacterized protein n=1 Tax=Adineta steineri TaxID=433720 RepID=A0A815SAL4_9BILA|nr:unnamed protein product [Adineta steineri]
MSGLDEENCDHLEFNECSDDEYRCMSGMCISEKYFLDGEFDCLDWSDEIPYYDDTNCPKNEVSAECDDRICPPNQWSCGDGQCILDRFGFQIDSKYPKCVSQRDQYFICETYYERQKWTLPNGRCYEGKQYNDSTTIDSINYEPCEYLLRCGFSRGIATGCPCMSQSSCASYMSTICAWNYIRYPKLGVVAPYALTYYLQQRTSSIKRPDQILIDGVIKCKGILADIRNVQLLTVWTNRNLEQALCQRQKNRSNLNSHLYDQHCHHPSLTFNNRSYNSTDICKISKECISIYRLRDGIQDCVDQMDETTTASISVICSKMQRYRFRCSIEEPTCLSVTALGNNQKNCQNAYDELWLGNEINVIDMNCNRFQKGQCEFLQKYIENSWTSYSNSDTTELLRISFHEYCDTFWNLASKEDEDLDECKNWWVCPEEQWQCHTGQCIDEKWVLDGEWDCFDASDEGDIFSRLISDRNFKIISPIVLWVRKNDLNIREPFSEICNPATEFPCFPLSTSVLLSNLTHNRPCINRSQIGDGHMDCYGAIDERNTIEHCNKFTMLGHNFKCASTDQCIPYQDHCFRDRCNISFDDGFWCDLQRSSLDCNSSLDSVCFNGHCAKKGRCNRAVDCSSGEDEYMCNYKSTSKSNITSYRQNKQDSVKVRKRILRLIPFPIQANVTRIEQNSTIETTLTKRTSWDGLSTEFAYRCNRGVGIQAYNDSIVCFCPPQYYGDKCQYHTDRITVLLHLNLSQSIYTIDSDIHIVLKMVVLFLFNDEVIMNHIFHVRPAVEIFVYTKKMVHFLYSRSSRLLQHKQQRYFNHSNIISDHPYSVRIEMYEEKYSEKLILMAVWQYPIYFDYLPVFRLAEVLRLTDMNMRQNPCFNHRCSPNQECQPLLNEKSKYICLCKNNYGGKNCSIAHRHCMTGYCAFGSLCKPNYRGLLVGNEPPYCICPSHRFGEQCAIEHDQCLSKPCQNDGSCFPTSKPNTVLCLCTEKYYGGHCEWKKFETKVYINESPYHAAAVVQYFHIDSFSLRLILTHQQVYRTLPTTVQYWQEKETAPEIILVKLYSSSQTDVTAQLYAISIQLNVTSIETVSQLTETTQCVNVHSLISKHQTQAKSNFSRIKYHHLCRNNTSLLCFRDDFYLCLCSDNHSRAECFHYDDKLDHCSYCLSGGQCLKGDRFRAKDFICLCPSCHSGSRCQFNSKSFAFTLDQLFFGDLTSNDQNITVRLLIVIPILLFLIAIPNNFFSILTFRRQTCLTNGVGQYLLCMSIINQFNLGFLAARLVHLAMILTGLHTQPVLANYLCKILNYLLTSSGRMVYWLSSLVAIERAYMTLFLNGRWLKKPYVARRLIIITVAGILITGMYELFFVKVLFGVHHNNDGMCVLDFPITGRSAWDLAHSLISIMNSVLPLLINICCTITISCVIIKNKMNIRKKNPRTYQRKYIKNVTIN